MANMKWYFPVSWINGYEKQCKFIKLEYLCLQTYKAKTNTYSITDCQREKQNVLKNNKNAKRL